MLGFHNPIFACIAPDNMTNATIKAELGSGIFTVSDIAEILDLKASKVRYWLKEYWDGIFAEQSQQQYSWGAGVKAVNFYTLIEFFVYYQ